MNIRPIEVKPLEAPKVSEDVRLLMRMLLDQVDEQAPDVSAFGDSAPCSGFRRDRWGNLVP